MKKLKSFIRITFSLFLAIAIAFVGTAILIPNSHPAILLVCIFGLPISIVWIREARRAHLEREATRDQSASAAQDDERQLTGRPKEAQASPPRPSEPQKKPHRQDYSAIVRAGQSTRTKSVRKSGWVPKSQSVTVAGRDIGGMVYVGVGPRDRYGRTPRAYVDPSLSAVKPGRYSTYVHLNYWPDYSSIGAEARGVYLDWLAGGRQDNSVNPGYMFLYFYGLERRFMLDNPEPDEMRAIVNEVIRLRALFPDNGSVGRYLGEFLDVAQLKMHDETLPEPVFDHAGWEVPLSVKTAIGTQLAKGQALSAEWMLSWFMSYPERRLRTSATRCRAEFLALFKLRFEERYPDGLKINAPKAKLKETYRAASGEFEGTLDITVNGAPVPDITHLRKPITIAQGIAEEVMADLDKLSRYLGRNPDDRGSLEAQALLPQELWAQFPSAELDQLRNWAEAIVAEGGLVPVADVIEGLEGVRPDKLTKRALTGAADVLARIGYRVAPDPRFALRAPKLDEPVVLFELGEAVGALEDVSDRYRAALIELGVGSFVVHADGIVVEAERTALTEKIQSIGGLTDQERARLMANLQWMLAVPPDMALLRRRLKGADAEAQGPIRAALIAAAHSDGVIQAEEVAGIEKAYKALGLDPGLVYADLHAGTVADGPVRVRAAQSGAAGEAIPPEPVQGLDAARIAAIKMDTARVSSVLGAIFDDEPDEDEATPEQGSGVLEGLDAAHTDLVRALIGQEQWSAAAFDALCAKAGLMPAAAVEELNEWAFEAHDEPLLDLYDGYEVSPDLAPILQELFKEETRHVQTETA